MIDMVDVTNFITWDLQIDVTNLKKKKQIDVTNHKKVIQAFIN